MNTEEKYSFEKLMAEPEIRAILEKNRFLDETPEEMAANDKWVENIKKRQGKSV